MKSKVMSVFLAVFLVTTTFMGCSKTNERGSLENKNTSGTNKKNSSELDFNPDKYEEQTYNVNGKEVKVRAYEKIIYVDNPVDAKYQCMNIYIPSVYFESKSVGNFTADSAPIFFQNEIGGYMPAEPGIPSMEGAIEGDASRIGKTSNSGNSTVQTPNSILYALSKGYVVASPGARGRTNKDDDGTYYGKAPAAIIDLKAAVRYLRYNDKVMPGNAEKIIANGTSAGGALAVLLGATGDNPDYKPYLTEIGAAKASDNIYAVSAYCPITNLNNADMAYEWLFNGYNDYTKMNITMVNGKIKRQKDDKTLTSEQIQYSNELKMNFLEYVNSLKLKDNHGKDLFLDSQGNGTFKDYLKTYLIASAQDALDSGENLAEYTSWITIVDNKVIDFDMAGYTLYLGRAKAAPAFDNVDLQNPNPENNLFGTETIDNQHFTKFSYTEDTKDGTKADDKIIKMMNPMDYIGNKDTKIAQFWRIRHGAKDSDTAIAIPTILARALQSDGKDVNFAVPWNQGHGGDYDLEELFTWINKIAK